MNRSKWGDLQSLVRDCRIQSPHSTESDAELLKILVSKAGAREGGHEGRMRDVNISAIGV